MEDLLAIIIQFIFELLLQTLAELPWDLVVGSRAGTNDASPAAVLIFLSLAAGSCVGGASLFVFPTTLLHWGSVRMANLLVAPTVSALVSFRLGRRSAQRAAVDAGSPASDPKTRAICAACFTLMLALVRFAFAARP